MGQGDIAAVSELLDVATDVDGHRPLGEHQWLDLVQGGREGFAGLVAWEPGHGHPVAYAQLTRGAGSWALGSAAAGSWPAPSIASMRASRARASAEGACDERTSSR